MNTPPSSPYPTVSPREGMHTRWQDGWGVLVAHLACPDCLSPTSRVLGGGFGGLGGHWLRLRCEVELCGRRFRRQYHRSPGHASHPEGRRGRPAEMGAGQAEAVTVLS